MVRFHRPNEARRCFRIIFTSIPHYVSEYCYHPSDRWKTQLINDEVSLNESVLSVGRPTDLPIDQHSNLRQTLNSKPLAQLLKARISHFSLCFHDNLSSHFVYLS